MSDWTGGYVTDAPYPIAFQAAQTPAHLAMVCALAGVAWQPQAQMAVADLGCGRGYVANTLAAANPGWTVWGLDHAPAHIAEARQTATLAQLPNAHFREADLAALGDAELDALPPLDVVMLHGVWTWVSDDVRAGVLRLLQRRLKPGGLVYVGYNALPAAGADAALQRLLCHLAGTSAGSSAGPGGAGQSEAAAARAMAQLRQLAPALPLARTPMLQRLLAEPSPLHPAFVAHEFLARHWRPVFHEDLSAALATAKLQYVGSSNLFEALPGLYAQAGQLAVMRDLPEGAAREFVKDLCLPRSFRADVFVRGARPVDSLQALGALVLGALQALPEDSPVLGTGTAQAALSAAVWQGLRAALGQGPQRLDALCARLQAQGLKPPHPAELLVVLVGTGQVLPLWHAAERMPAASRFNLAAAALHAQGGSGAGHFALAAPAAAGGLPADALDLALVAAVLRVQHGDEPVDVDRVLQAMAAERSLAASSTALATTSSSAWACSAEATAPAGDADAAAPVQAHPPEAAWSERAAARLSERLPFWRSFGVV